jgi:hypothetical protein
LVRDPVWAFPRVDLHAKGYPLIFLPFLWTVMYLAYFVDRLSRRRRLALHQLCAKLLQAPRVVLVLHPSSLPASPTYCLAFSFIPLASSCLEAVSSARSYLSNHRQDVLLPIEFHLLRKLEFNKPRSPLTIAVRSPLTNCNPSISSDRHLHHARETSGIRRASMASSLNFHAACEMRFALHRNKALSMTG